MAEAHQRLAVLQEEAERHADIANSTVNEHARRAIHTWAALRDRGISALAELSHALEQYWNRFVHVRCRPPTCSGTRYRARLHDMIAIIEGGHLPDPAHI